MENENHHHYSSPVRRKNFKEDKVTVCLGIMQKRGLLPVVILWCGSIIKTRRRDISVKRVPSVGR
jgi:hypothetical protein